ncbi:putative permease abc transporter protein [Roseibium aggregatum IAM 12614]|uniref:Putative permease abc transporter protein n=1 Tax=Roseibium aggregatum (strain ATCC 25650 / DSM 13394 / JCM 20685 / NBRC 16684 / NCIMB 2208 / IAM 12614 / B1) TaxID=384765 RepID=A0NS54_ROSAI|nr:ABC transporter permease subunit [Roseibium aggregatum]EAV44383.1 putative permease abc transporter protein [Roseibium aggregatum IAM 12614]
MTTKPRAGPAVPVILVSVFLAGPVLAGLAGTLLPAFGYLPALGRTGFSLEPIRHLFQQPGLMTSVWLSLATGLMASVLSLAIVLLFVAGWSGTRTFRRLTRFLSPLLSVPHAAAAIGLAFLIAPSGFLVRLVSPWVTGWTRPPDVLILNDPLGIAMTMGLVAKEVPFLFLMTLAALNRPRIQEYFKAGASLGYGRVATFFTIVLPQIYPLIRLPVLAVIAYATSVVDVAAILGPTTPAPLAPRLVLWMNDPNLAYRLMASAGALLQLAVSAVALGTYLAGERLIAATSKRHLVTGHRHLRERTARYGGLLVMVTIIAAMVLSLMLLGLWSAARSWWFPAVLPQAWNVMRMADTLGMSLGLLGTTVALASASALVATALTLWLLENRDHRKTSSSRRLKTLVFLPLLLPQISFLFGLQLLFLSADFSGTFTAVLLAHLVFVLPYAFLALSDPWARLDPRYAKAAAAIGASRGRIFWQIRLPLLLRPVLVTLAVAAAVSVGQYLPTLMVGAGRIVTVTTESVALASGGSRQSAALLALLQLGVPLAGFVLAALLPALLHRNRAAMRLER